MNFYKRYIGDIQRDTGHLSLAEMGAYDRLLDHYYATEQRLPGDLEACHRIARAMTKDERKSVENVLRQFFQLEDEGYTQGRAEREITQAKPALTAARTQQKQNRNLVGFQNKTQAKPNKNPTRNLPIARYQILLPYPRARARCAASCESSASRLLPIKSSCSNCWTSIPTSKSWPWPR